MNRFTAINLSGMIPPDAIEGIDYEAIVKAMRDDLVARFPLIAGVIDLESEPARKLIEVFAYREMLDLARINDAVRAVMVAFSTGSDLEHLGAFFGVSRRLITAAGENGEPAVYESDAELRARINVAPESLPYAGLTGGGYRHLALLTAPAVKDARAVKRRDANGHPVMDVILLERTGDGAASAATVEAVYRAFLDDEATQLTDVVTVRSATIVPYEIEYTLRLPRGPDASLIAATSRAAVQAVADEMHAIGAVVPTDAIIAAARLKPTIKLELLSPTVDVDPGVDGAAWCSSITVNTEIVDG